jgi:crotonobetainyl-CoA:carnitine CoA-transferase CaiB-like acyl-CoA transferase
VPVLISIQNDREFERLCHSVIDRPGLEKDPDYATGIARNERRDATNAIVRESFAHAGFAELAARSTRRRSPGRGSAHRRAVEASAAPAHVLRHAEGRRLDAGARRAWDGEPERLGDVPELGQHTDEVRREFAA